ncbi:MAG: NCS2 family permease, partial [Ignavibacteria bacterium]
MSKYFQFDAYGTDYKTEIVAGITTFLSMSYIIIVNPKILEAAGIPFGPSFTATILTAFFGTITMGLYAKRPFAIAPYMGENAFIAYTVVGVLGYSWQTAIGAIFISGVLFTIITLLNIRSWLANAVPKSLKIAFAIGIGLFLTFIGLNDTGIVTLGVKGAPVHIGNLTNTTVILSIVGFITIGILMLRKVNAAILIGIIVTTLLGIILGETELPKAIVSTPPSLSETFLALDIPGALSWGFFAVILTVLVMDFIDTMGTLIGMSYKA